MARVGEGGRCCGMGGVVHNVEGSGSPTLCARGREAGLPIGPADSKNKLIAMPAYWPALSY